MDLKLKQVGFRSVLVSGPDFVSSGPPASSRDGGGGHSNGGSGGYGQGGGGEGGYGRPVYMVQQQNGGGVLEQLFGDFGPILLLTGLAAAAVAAGAGVFGLIQLICRRKRSFAGRGLQERLEDISSRIVPGEKNCLFIFSYLYLGLLSFAELYEDQ